MPGSEKEAEVEEEWEREAELSGGGLREDSAEEAAEKEEAEEAE